MRLFFAVLLLLPSLTFADTVSEPPIRDRLAAFETAQAFDCQNVSCKRLKSCAEACYKLVQCGQSTRDGDKDGIPCENLCSSRC